MFGNRKWSLLDNITDRTVRELNRHEIGSEEYVKTLDALSKLHKMREEERPSSVSKDTMIIVGANLLGIILIISHEGVNVISSKALNLILKPKL